MSEVVREQVMREAQQDFQLASADAVERVKIQASLADRALQALLISNGGALIALFSFVASSSAIRLSVAATRSAFGLFVTGLFLGLVAHLLAFMSQDRFMHSSFAQMLRFQRMMNSGEREDITEDELRYYRTGNHYYYAGIVLAFGSILAFTAGCGAALFGLAS
ncbi:hypothetical protein [Rhizorhabdus sp.]|uniref:hypothetical protein n=1 Tax=Rhizorhabdus sp. TaxID=1968843 RepID=UPI0035AD9B42